MPISQTNRWRFSPLLKTLLVLVGVLVLLFVLEVTNTTHFFHKQRAVSGVIPSSSPKRTAATNKAQGQSSNSSSVPGSNNTNTTSTTGAAIPKTQGSTPSVSGVDLVAPYGTFVSNHRPNLSGSPAPSGEQSTCQTTPGATCTIKFTNVDGVVKTLSAKTADQDGVVIWQWDVKDAGFTMGSWKITATATLNGASKSTTDPQNLEVGA